MNPEAADFSHLDEEGKPQMVGVGEKAVTKRLATAIAIVKMEDKILEKLEGDGFNGPKGPVFQTAIIAGTMAVKKTSDLIPLCHPLTIEKINFDIEVNKEKKIEIRCSVSLHAKTGVEMEAMTGASVAALTIYDMCKALSHNIIIEEIKLMKKSGGKRDFERN